MKRLLLATAAVLAVLYGPAIGADLPNPLAVKALAPIVAPFNWSGCWAVMLAGGTGGNSQSGSPDAGGMMECDSQYGNLVVGLRADAAGTKIQAGQFGQIASRFIAAGGGRVGYAFNPYLGTFAGIPFNNLLAYAIAEFPAADVSGPLGSGMQTGKMFGGGLETVLVATPTVTMTMRGEYRWSEIAGITSNTGLMGVALKLP